MTEKRLRVVVCMKQVPENGLAPDVASRIGMLPGNDTAYLVDNLDLQAVEQAVLWKQDGHAAEVVVVSLGPERVEEALHTGLAMGADRAVHIGADDADWSPQQTASVLAKVLAQLAFDVILCGERSSDGGSALVGPAVAEMLDLPQVTAAYRLEIPGDHTRILAHRRLEKGRREIVTCELPALVSVARGLSSPRYTSMIAVRRARNKPLQRITLEELGCSADGRGTGAPTVQLVALAPPRPRPKPIFAPGGHLPAHERLRLLLAGAPDKEGSWLEGEPDEVAQRIVSFLKAHGVVSQKRPGRA